MGDRLKLGLILDLRLRFGRGLGGFLGDGFGLRRFGLVLAQVLGHHLRLGRLEVIKQRIELGLEALILLVRLAFGMFVLVGQVPGSC